MLVHKEIIDHIKELHKEYKKEFIEIIKQDRRQTIDYLRMPPKKYLEEFNPETDGENTARECWFLEWINCVLRSLEHHWKDLPF